jgi:hypothetical protein
MAASDWRLEGEWIKNCTCAFGCPCDFNALPTEGYCKGMVGMRITKGHFENTKLDGLVFAGTVHFPGALHEGNGELQPIIDERATAEQREALFNIMSGKFSAEGTLFHIFSLIVTKIHDPLFVPILVRQRWARGAYGCQGRAGDRGRADQEPGNRRASPHSGGDARGIRAQGGRGCLGQHPLDRRHQVRHQGHP